MEKKREIKFRFWDKVEKKMIYPANSFPNLDYLHFEDIEFDNWDEDRVVKSDKEKLQYVLYILKDII